MFDYRKPASRLANRTARPVLALLMGSVLVSCTGPGAGTGLSRYEPTYLRMTNEHEFGQELRRHYLELATNAFDRGDTGGSDRYSLRALMAAEGKLAHPAQQSGGGELATTGARLSQLLSSGARTGSPDLAARAQAAYDCWLLESGPEGDVGVAQACRYNAMMALTELESASTGAPVQVAAVAPRPHHHAAHGQTQSYVVQQGQSRTIQAPGGYTIQIITEHHAPVAAPAPAHYTTVVPHSAPQQVRRVKTVQRAAPRVVKTVPHSAPAMIETVPVIEQAPVAYVEQAPMVQHIMAPVAIEPIQQSIPTVELAMAPPRVVEMAPIVHSPMVEMAPIESGPIYSTTPIETAPAIELSALPMAETAAAQALIDANTSMGDGLSVFFGFDSDEVTIEAEDVLIDAIEQIRLGGASRVTLMGYTDSMGDARYNQLLAMRRAQAVRQFLQGQLGDEVSFNIMPVGEVEAVQNGGDGVQEALNRKVRITFE